MQRSSAGPGRSSRRFSKLHSTEIRGICPAASTYCTSNVGCPCGPGAHKGQVELAAAVSRR